MKDNKHQRIIREAEERIIRHDDKVLFTTSSGKEVEILPVSPWLIDNIQIGFDESWKEEHGGKIPGPPTYKAKTGDGPEDFVLMEHDTSTLADGFSPEEAAKNKADWDNYQEQLTEYSAEKQKLVVRAILLRGVRFDYPEDDSWVDEQKFLGAHVPDDPAERKYHYIRTEVFGSAEDIRLVVQEVMRSVTIDREEVDRIKAEVFPGEMEGVGLGEDQGPEDIELGGE